MSFKKMVLVDEAQFESINKHLHPQNIVDSAHHTKFTQFETDLSNLLSNSEMSLDEKIARYRQTMSKLLQFVNLTTTTPPTMEDAGGHLETESTVSALQTRTRSPSPKTVTTTTTTTPPATRSTSQSLIPNRGRPKLSAFLHNARKFLEEHVDREKARNGLLIFRGQQIDSQIVDELISETINTIGSFQHPFRNEFKDFLLDTNFPIKYIPNKLYRSAFRVQPSRSFKVRAWK